MVLNCEQLPQSRDFSGSSKSNSSSSGGGWVDPELPPTMPSSPAARAASGTSTPSSTSRQPPQSTLSDAPLNPYLQQQRYHQQEDQAPLYQQQQQPLLTEYDFSPAGPAAAATTDVNWYPAPGGAGYSSPQQYQQCVATAPESAGGVAVTSPSMWSNSAGDTFHQQVRVRSIIGISFCFFLWFKFYAASSCCSSSC